MKEYTASTPFPTNSIFNDTTIEGASNFKEFRKDVAKQEKKIMNALDNIGVDRKKAEAQDIKDSVKNKGLSSTIKVLSKKAGQATVVGGLSAIGLLPIALIAAKKFSKDNDRARKDAIEQIDKELLIAEVKMEKYKSEGKPGLYAKWVITRKKLLQAKGQLRR